MVPKIDRSNWAKTIKAIVLNLKFIRGVMGDPLDYMVRQHVKVVSACLAWVLTLTKR